MKSAVDAPRPSVYAYSASLLTSPSELRALVRLFATILGYTPKEFQKMR
jgi:hypothetical protein